MTQPRKSLSDALPPIELIRESVQRALAEDIGPGDVSAQLIPETKKANAKIICRKPTVICGLAWANEVFSQVDTLLKINWLVIDGEKVDAGGTICEIYGSARHILTAERCALNFLQTLSGTATLAGKYADAITGTNVVLLDTRKTLPGWRHAQKYAVACGGCRNHRMGLFDAFLIKENHIRAAGSITAAINAARQLNPSLMIEVEVESLQELEEAITAKPDRIMLDNFSIKQMETAVQLTAGRIALEASGNISLDNLRVAAQTGVDFISIGALTKDIVAADLSLLLE